MTRTPEQMRQQEEWNEGKRWTDSLVTEVTVEPVDTNLDDARRIHLLIEGSLADAWEHCREEAEETLRTSPDDPKALETLQEYRDYTRRQALPEEKRAGLILVKPSEKRKRGMTLSKKGVYVRDAKYGWLVKASGQTGDVITVRKRDGTEDTVKLTERVFAGMNFFTWRKA